jgi:ssDNA-binding Zn-finger/Zn-ribbon topoisomerase 1
MSKKIKSSLSDIDRMVRECAYEILVMEQVGFEKSEIRKANCPECGGTTLNIDTHEGEANVFCNNKECGYEDWFPGKRAMPPAYRTQLADEDRVYDEDQRAVQAQRDLEKSWELEKRDWPNEAVCHNCGSGNIRLDYSPNRDPLFDEPVIECEDCGWNHNFAKNENIPDVYKRAFSINEQSQSHLNPYFHERTDTPTKTLSDGTLVVDTFEIGRKELFAIKQFANRMYNGQKDPLYKVVSDFLVIEDLEYLQNEINSYDLSDVHYAPEDPRGKRDAEEWENIVVRAKEAINKLVDRYRAVIDSLNEQQGMNEQMRKEIPEYLQYEDYSDPSAEPEVDEFGYSVVDPDVEDDDAFESFLNNYSQTNHDDDVEEDDISGDIAPYMDMREQAGPRRGFDPDSYFEPTDSGSSRQIQKSETYFDDDDDEFDDDSSGGVNLYGDIDNDDYLGDIDSDIKPYHRSDDGVRNPRSFNEQEEVGGYYSDVNFGSNPDIYAESNDMEDSVPQMNETDHMHEVIAYNFQIGCDPVNLVEGLRKVGLGRDNASDKVRNLLGGAEVTVRDGLTEATAIKVKNVLKSYGFECMIYKPTNFNQIPVTNFPSSFKLFGN